MGWSRTFNFILYRVKNWNELKTTKDVFALTSCDKYPYCIPKNGLFNIFNRNNLLIFTNNKVHISSSGKLL